MSRYDITEDPLCYPGTGVLRNKANLTDQDELDQLEQIMFLTRSEEPLPEGALDYAHYRAIHHHFFQDVYAWAGQPRQIRTAKGGNWFCYPEYIDTEMTRIFRELAEENHLAKTNSLQDFARRAAHYIADINAVHPLEWSGCSAWRISVFGFGQVETSGHFGSALSALTAVTRKSHEAAGAHC